MLETLKEYDVIQSQGILAGLTTRLLPNDTELKKLALEGVSQEVIDEGLEEIRRKLRISADDRSHRARTRMLDFINKEISRVSLSSKKSLEIKSRLGQKGDLSVSLYQIKYSPSFYDNFQKLGARKSEVEETIRFPDLFKHYHGADPQTEGESLSLFIKRVVKDDQVKSYSNLVVVARSGFDLIVHHALRLYHNDVDLSEANSPIDMLRQFVDKYGVKFQIGDERRHFFWEMAVKADLDDTAENKFSVDIGELRKGNLLFMRARPRNEFIQVQIAYMIDIELYKNVLRNHGVLIAK